MAIINIEILNFGKIRDDSISNSIRLINKNQDAFKFSYLENRSGDFLDKNYLNTSIVYDYLKEYIEINKGYHPYIIGITDLQLNGEKYSNLFGSMQEIENKLSGFSIMSTSGIDRILKNKPIEIYLIFEMLSFAIRFIYGKGLIHDRIEYCIFDKKINKNDLIKVLEKIHFCNSCKELLYEKVLDKDQIISIENILSIIRKVYWADNPQNEFQEQINISNTIFPKVFLSHSSTDKPIVEKIANYLVHKSINVWFDKWEIKYGDNIVQKISDGLSESDYLCLVVSNNSIKSGWVLNEYSSVLSVFHKKGKPKIIPILIESCEIPALIIPLKYIDLRTSNKFEENIISFCDEILQ